VRPGAASGHGGSHPDIARLAETDELLDRIGRRSPNLRDLDDPVLASLAVLAADVDLDEAPLQRTRGALTRHDLWPPRVDAVRTLQPWGDDLAVLTAPEPAEPEASSEPDRWSSHEATMPDTVSLPIPRGQESEELDAPSGSVAWITPAPQTRAEALAAEATRDADRCGPGRAESKRVVSLRLLPALGAAGAALVLSMGAAAALTNGRSVNPATAFSEMIGDIAESGSRPSTSSSDAHGAQQQGEVSGGQSAPAPPGSPGSITVPGATGSPESIPSASAPSALMSRTARVPVPGIVRSVGPGETLLQTSEGSGAAEQTTTAADDTLVADETSTDATSTASTAAYPGPGKAQPKNDHRNDSRGNGASARRGPAAAPTSAPLLNGTTAPVVSSSGLTDAPPAS